MLSPTIRAAPRRLGASRRFLSVKANTLVYPTPEAVETWLGTVKKDAVLLYSLSANLGGWQSYLPMVQGYESEYPSNCPSCTTMLRSDTADSQVSAASITRRFLRSLSRPSSAM